MAAFQNIQNINFNLMRVLSLIASSTEIVYTLGCGDKLVGRSHECNPPPLCKKVGEHYKLIPLGKKLLSKRR